MIDLMDALRKSVADAKKQKTKAEPDAKATPAAKRTSSRAKVAAKKR